MPWAVAGVVLLLVAGTAVGAKTGLIPVGTMEPRAVEDAIGRHLASALEGDVQVTCPDTILQQKGRVTDCSAELPSGRRAAVYVEQIDTGGHFRFETDTVALGDELQDKIARDSAEREAQIERDTAAAVAALPRQTFVEWCKTGYGERACGCAYGRLAQPARDEALVGLLAMRPTETFLDAVEACGGTTD
jgi:hypothetical protein